jgi:hypothetical protein
VASRDQISGPSVPTVCTISLLTAYKNSCELNITAAHTGLTCQMPFNNGCIAKPTAHDGTVCDSESKQ